MRYLDRIAALAGISLAACGGGSPIPPDLTPAAAAEATKTLEAAKTAVAKSYESSRTVPVVKDFYSFPTTANAPFPTRPDPNAVYVGAVSYMGTSASSASVVVTLTGTGNSNVDGHFLGMFGVGHTDGTVTWMCGTASSTTATSPGAQTTMYPYLPAACQH